MGFSCRKRDPGGFCAGDNGARSLFLGHLAQPPPVQDGECRRPNAMRNYLRRFYTHAVGRGPRFSPPGRLEPAPSPKASFAFGFKVRPLLYDLVTVS
jgi:hypothetical protein